MHNLEHVSALFDCERCAFKGDLEVKAALHVRLLGPAVYLNQRLFVR